MFVKKHMVHGTGIFTYMSGWFLMLDAGKYRIHGSYGNYLFLFDLYIVYGCLWPPWLEGASAAYAELSTRLAWQNCLGLAEPRNAEAHATRFGVWQPHGMQSHVILLEVFWKSWCQDDDCTSDDSDKKTHVFLVIWYRIRQRTSKNNILAFERVLGKPLGWCILF